MSGKLTDDQTDGLCLALACLGVLTASCLIVISVLMIIIVVRGCALGC